MTPDAVDLFRYQDLRARLAAFSVNGGRRLAGDDQDVQVEDAEIVMRQGEQELARFGGMVVLAGMTETQSNDGPGLALVIEGTGVVVVTTVRLVLMATGGISQLGGGEIPRGQIQTFSLPWDLVDGIAMPARKSVTDRIAGARPIDIGSVTTLCHLRLTPANTAEIDGRVVSVTDDDVMRRLVGAAVTNRMTVTPPTEHERLRALLDGRFEVEDGDVVAAITANETDGPAVHLVGRLVERDEQGQRVAPETGYVLPAADDLIRVAQWMGATFDEGNYQAVFQRRGGLGDSVLHPGVPDAWRFWLNAHPARSAIRMGVAEDPQAVRYAQLARRAAAQLPAQSDARRLALEEIEAGIPEPVSLLKQSPKVTKLSVADAIAEAQWMGERFAAGEYDAVLKRRAALVGRLDLARVEPGWRFWLNAWPALSALRTGALDSSRPFEYGDLAEAALAECTSMSDQRRLAIEEIREGLGTLARHA